MFFDEKAAEVIFQNQKDCLFLLYGSDKTKSAPYVTALETASN